jgi:hypothetical protein
VPKPAKTSRARTAAAMTVRISANILVAPPVGIRRGAGFWFGF